MAETLRLDLDRHLWNADWTKQSWDLPPYKSPEFMRSLRARGATITQFRRLPVYRNAVESGLIADDEWTGKTGGIRPDK